MKRAKIECTNTVDQSTGEPYTIYDITKVDGNPGFVCNDECELDEALELLLAKIKLEVKNLLSEPDGMEKIVYWLSE